jgi:hypothetical protein
VYGLGWSIGYDQRGASLNPHSQRLVVKCGLVTPAACLNPKPKTLNPKNAALERHLMGSSPPRFALAGRGGSEIVSLRHSLSVYSACQIGPSASHRFQ